jgi:predicted dehydrogenase
MVQVGLGGWGWSWMQIVRDAPGWELAAVVDIDRKRLADAGAQYGLRDDQLHQSLDSAVAVGGLDACLVVVPPEAHAEVAIAASRAGLHSLVEKPLADTVAAAKSMVDAAAEAGVRLMVNQNYRYRRAPRTVRKLIRDGAVGEVGAVGIQFRKAAHFGGGFRERMAHPLVVDMAIHHFDQLRGTVGFEPVEVTARSWNPKWSWFDGDAMASAILRAESGAVATYTGSWVAQGADTTWDGDWRIEGADGEINWTDNTVTLKPQSVFTSVFVPGAREEHGRLAFDLLKLDAEDRQGSLAAFRDAVLAGEEGETSGRDNLRTLATVIAVRTSIERGESVTIEEVLSSPR